jgi:hypothetical protein
MRQKPNSSTPPVLQHDRALPVGFAGGGQATADPPMPAGRRRPRISEGLLWMYITGRHGERAEQQRSAPRRKPDFDSSDENVNGRR